MFIGERCQCCLLVAIFDCLLVVLAAEVSSSMVIVVSDAISADKTSPLLGAKIPPSCCAELRLV